jgi:hypothetical protein
LWNACLVRDALRRLRGRQRTGTRENGTSERRDEPARLQTDNATGVIASIAPLLPPARGRQLSARQSLIEERASGERFIGLAKDGAVTVQREIKRGERRSPRRSGVF